MGTTSSDNQTEPTTPTGKRLQRQGELSEDWGIQYASLKDILAIEAEAREQERERIKQAFRTEAEAEDAVMAARWTLAGIDYLIDSLDPSDD